MFNNGLTYILTDFYGIPIDDTKEMIGINVNLTLFLYGILIFLPFVIGPLIDLTGRKPTLVLSHFLAALSILTIPFKLPIYPYLETQIFLSLFPTIVGSFIPFIPDLFKESNHAVVSMLMYITE